jgi:hypothetical protein
MLLSCARPSPSYVCNLRSSAQHAPVRDSECHGRIGRSVQAIQVTICSSLEGSSALTLTRPQNGRTPAKADDSDKNASHVVHWAKSQLIWLQDIVIAFYAKMDGGDRVARRFLFAPLFAFTCVRYIRPPLGFVTWKCLFLDKRFSRAL